MTRPELILSAVLAISLVINVGLIAYVRVAVVKLISVSDELNDLQRMINSFANHLKAVYELDSFYGDETLRALLEHAISLNEQMDTFDYIISLTEKESTPNADETKGTDQDQQERHASEEETRQT